MPGNPSHDARRSPPRARQRTARGLAGRGVHAVAGLGMVAALLAASPAHAAGKSVDEATAAEKSEAGNRYSAAMADFERNEFEKALAGFRESHGIVRSPNSRFMIARTLAKLGRNAEAYTELDAVIADASALGERYSDTVTAAFAKKEEIRPRVGLVTVTLAGAPKNTRVLVGDEELPADRVGKPVAVLPGESVVTAITPDGKRRTTTRSPGLTA